MSSTNIDKAEAFNEFAKNNAAIWQKINSDENDLTKSGTVVEILVADKIKDIEKLLKENGIKFNKETPLDLAKEALLQKIGGITKEDAKQLNLAYKLEVSLEQDKGLSGKVGKVDGIIDETTLGGVLGFIKENPNFMSGISGGLEASRSSAKSLSTSILGNLEKSIDLKNR
jgi:hypothetical protein